MHAGITAITELVVRDVLEGAPLSLNIMNSPESKEKGEEIAGSGCNFGKS